MVAHVLDQDGRLGRESLGIRLHPDQFHDQDVGDVVLLIGLEHVVLELREELAHAGVHDLVLDVGVRGQELDHLLDEPTLLSVRVLAGLLEGVEGLLDLFVVVLEQHDRVS